MAAFRGTLTYSPAYTLVPTYECFNRCAYCNFRAEPGSQEWLTLEEARDRLLQVRPRGVREILILSGEVHPHSPQRPAWFERIYELCELSLSLGFLPHTNAGPLLRPEMQRMKDVNVSMGLMLEQVTPKLLETVHRHAPSKQPEVRLEQLRWAGELGIPFTTGLLIGLGETMADRQETLEAIAQIHGQWGHIQEVILQPHSLGSQQLWQGASADAAAFVETVAIARQILPPAIAVQIPPNLLHRPEILLQCLEAGARDLGGLGPRDEVNPDYPHPTVAALDEILRPQGWHLTPRLPVYAAYDPWLPTSLQAPVQAHRQSLAQASGAIAPAKTSLPSHSHK